MVELPRSILRGSGFSSYHVYEVQVRRMYIDFLRKRTACNLSDINKKMLKSNYALSLFMIKQGEYLSWRRWNLIVRCCLQAT